MERRLKPNNQWSAVKKVNGKAVVLQRPTGAADTTGTGMIKEKMTAKARGGALGLTPTITGPRGDTIKTAMKLAIVVTGTDGIAIEITRIRTDVEIATAAHPTGTRGVGVTAETVTDLGGTATVQTGIAKRPMVSLTIPTSNRRRTSPPDSPPQQATNQQLMKSWSGMASSGCPATETKSNSILCKTKLMVGFKTSPALTCKKIVKELLRAALF